MKLKHSTERGFYVHIIDEHPTLGGTTVVLRPTDSEHEAHCYGTREVSDAMAMGLKARYEVIKA